MNENDLYALWERIARTGALLNGTRGERVIVLSPGRRNTSAGPDYPGAVLLINGQLHFGAVEMHVRESDWFAHGHHDDGAYRDVILHVLGEVPVHRMLDIPTYIPEEAIGCDRGSGDEIQSEGDHPEVSHDILSECAWNRLIRRATEVVRTEPVLTESERLNREFIRRIFRTLGSILNRDAMMATAELVLTYDDFLKKATFDRTLALVFAASGLDPQALYRVGKEFMDEERLVRILPQERHTGIHWKHSTRPRSAPELRLWAASKLLFDVYRNNLTERLISVVKRTGTTEAVHAALLVRFGSKQFIGREIAHELVINALLPIALAAGSLRGDQKLIRSVCTAYRQSSSLGSNRLIRNFERNYCQGVKLSGAFWQQGAIEFEQRYRTSDRSGLQFLAGEAIACYT